MQKKWMTGSWVAVVGFLMTSGVAFAAEGGSTASPWSVWPIVAIMIGCGLAIGIAAHGTGQGMGQAISAACEGTARNPEASGKLTVTMLIGLALIESLCIYALVVCLIMLFANPWADFIRGVVGG
jgi:F-type H+-transporting ATPase subunit c